MYLQGVVRFAFFCILAIEMRTVQADEPLVSLARDDDADMMFSDGNRRRWGWWKKVKKVFRWVKRYYYKTHPARLRACKKGCLVTSRRCGGGSRYARCFGACAGRCYVKARYLTYVWRRIRG